MADKPSIEQMLYAISQDLLQKAKEGSDNLSAAVEATGLVYGERAKSYGHRTECFHRAAKIMNAIKDMSDPNWYSGKKIALMMIAMKQARRQFKYIRDNNVDIIGYTDLLETLEREENELPLVHPVFAHRADIADAEPNIALREAAKRYDTAVKTGELRSDANKGTEPLVHVKVKRAYNKKAKPPKHEVKKPTKPKRK